jgi:hypothetical protein
MASITKDKNSYKVRIRRKDLNLFSHFKNKYDALLWAAYKEDLIDQIIAFDPPLKDMVTLQDAIELKIQNADYKSKKYLYDYKGLLTYFDKFKEKNLSEISYQDLLSHFDTLLNIPIRRGGNSDDNGIKKLPEPNTILKKYAYLSTVYQLMIEKGMEIENIPIKIVKFMRPKIGLK